MKITTFAFATGLNPYPPKTGEALKKAREAQEQIKAYNLSKGLPYITPRRPKTAMEVK